MILEEQIKTLKAIASQIEKLEEQKKALSTAILQQMQEKRVQFTDYTVHRYERFSIKISIEEARHLGATKKEEVVDKEKIKNLYQAGQEINGVSKIPYIFITSNKKK